LFFFRRRLFILSRGPRALSKQSGSVRRDIFFFSSLFQTTTFFNREKNDFLTIGFFDLLTVNSCESRET